jgi:hypothetical protein
VINDLNWTFYSQDSFCDPGIESLKVRIHDPQIDTNPCFYKSLIRKETLGLVVRQKTHDRESWVQTPAEETIFHAPFIWIKSWKNFLSPGTVACAVILQMGGWTLWMVDIYIYTKAINALWVDSWPRPKSNGRGENHLGRRVPSLQTSLYRSIWGECHVHRPLFTGRPSGLGFQGKCQVYRSLFTDHPLQVPSLPISLYRSLPKGRWKKKKISNTIPATLMKMVNKLMGS